MGIFSICLSSRQNLRWLSVILSALAYPPQPWLSNDHSHKHYLWESQSLIRIEQLLSVRYHHGGRTKWPMPRLCQIRYKTACLFLCFFDWNILYWCIKTYTFAFQIQGFIKWALYDASSTISSRISLFMNIICFQLTFTASSASQMKNK